LGETVTIQDRWLSVNELMLYLGVSRDTIYDWLASRRLPGHRVGRLWKFKQDEIDVWVKVGNAASPGTFPKRTKVKAGTGKGRRSKDPK
jgi:excisionase family DNA binding protein